MLKSNQTVHSIATQRAAKAIRLRWLALLCSALLPTYRVATAQTATDEFGTAVQTLLRAADHPLLRQRNFQRDRAALQDLYAGRDFRPVWLQDDALSRSGVLLLQTLRAADEFGLRLDDYDGTTLFYRGIDLITASSTTVQQRAQLDVGMSVAAARMVRHLHYGRIDPRLAGFQWNKPRAPLDITAALAGLATGNASGDDFAPNLAKIEPPHLHYRLLKQALQRYRLLAVDRELTDLPAFKGPSVKPGAAYNGIPELRRLLVALGDLPADTVTSDTMLDETLVQAVRHFQKRHGLSADGAIGRTTLAALRTPLSARVKQMALTLERWRWLPEFSTPPVLVNIPQFKLFAFRGTEDRAADVEQMDVIVGKTFPSLQTPIFAADLKYIVFRPYWDVTPTIIQEETLPALAADPNYLAKNNLEIVGADYATPLPPSPDNIAQLAAGKLRLRQRPGDDNSLGLVKLMLPNSYNVYLHSTPAQALFKEPRRAFSHGCIRVSDPAGLVEHVLRTTEGANAGWTRARIEAAMHDTGPAGNNKHVFLSKPVPVLIVYGTAMILEAGDVLFFEDIYGHDAKLEKLLRNRL
jgi:L,D-transpeptidase YcbB